MPELKVLVPTYYGSTLAAETDNTLPEFGDPHVPVVIRRADGVRIVLGSHDYFDGKSPDIQIERRPRGWAIFLHPLGGSDPSGYVYFLDDGRSFVVPESEIGATPAIVSLDCDGTVAEIDDFNETTDDCKQDSSKPEACQFCGVRLDSSSGDNWDGLCPECADFVSSFLDRRGLTDEDRDAAIALLKSTLKPPK